VRRSKGLFVSEQKLQLFIFHFLNPGVSEVRSFAETNDWKTQGSFIGAATINEGKSGSRRHNKRKKKDK